MSDLDIMATKAEARRKKILENAQRRMSKVQELKHQCSSYSSQTKIEGDLHRCDTEQPIVEESKVCHINPALQNEKVPSCLESASQTNNEETHRPDFTPKDMSFVLNELLLSGRGSETDCVVYDALKKCNVPTRDLSDDYPATELSYKPNGHSIHEELDPSKILKVLESNPSPQSNPCEQPKESSIKFVTLLYFIVLAIVVRLVLYFEYGWIFGNMILVPFALSESVLISLGVVHKSHLVQLLTRLMSLCGFSQQMLEFYTRLITILFYCVEDFNVYFVTFCILHSYLNEEILTS